MRPDAARDGLWLALPGAALRFCDAAGHRKVFLRTFEGLDATRHLDEKNG